MVHKGLTFNQFHNFSMLEMKRAKMGRYSIDYSAGITSYPLPDP